MTVARPGLAPLGETMFPAPAPFFKARLSSRAARGAACPEQKRRRNRTISPDALSPAHRPEAGL
jgi:hypothetical protein